MDWDLMITRVTIQVAEGVVRQPLEHYINEGYGEMNLPGGLVEFLTINAHTPTSDCPLRNELILLITDNNHSIFLQHDLYCTDTFTIENRVDDSSLE
jgi:hypothetical protein